MLSVFCIQIVLLLRLVPWLPFGMLNYLLSVTPVSLGEYTLASWLGMMVTSSPLIHTHTLAMKFWILYSQNIALCCLHTCIGKFHI